MAEILDYPLIEVKDILKEVYSSEASQGRGVAEFILEQIDLKERAIPNNNFLNTIIEKEAGTHVVKFISEQIDINKNKTILLSSLNNTTYKSLQPGLIKNVIDLQTVNIQDDLNSNFRSINSFLPYGGNFIGCVENRHRRKGPFLENPSNIINQIIGAFHFILHRLIPKLPLTKNIYLLFTRRRYNVISKAETLGRLAYAGFQITGHKIMGHLTYFSAVKISEPKNDNIPQYGILLKMNRIGKDGKIIKVYKVRSMHPYSEFIQSYIVNLNGYNKIGKPDQDFRLTKWGKVIRKLHLDELPQLLNVLKGELNIVGVRPLSKFGFESLPQDLQKERIKYKPGCIPPNKALGLTGFEGVIRAERIYLRHRRQKGRIVNYKYFWMSMVNMIKKKNLSA